MSRIRSIHPGLFTDESYMSLSIAAKAIWPGIWTEADDAGVFEWKPFTLKARLLPTENVDMKELLAELEANDLVRQFTQDGKCYGAVRGFCKWQRPRKPTYRFPLPSEFHTFVGWAHQSSAQDPDEGGDGAKPALSQSAEVPHQYRTGTEVSPQRKEEGGRREDEGGREKTRARAPARSGEPIPDGWQPSADDEAWVAVNRPDLSPDARKSQLERFRRHAIGKGLKAADWGLLWRNWISEAKGQATNGGGAAIAPDDLQWRARLRGHRWQPGLWGPPPGERGCLVPEHILADWRASQPTGDNGAGREVAP